MKPGLFYMGASHDPWCPMAYGEGTQFAPGCRPVLKHVAEDAFAQIVARDLRNRAQRRAAARRREVRR